MTGRLFKAFLEFSDNISRKKGCSKHRVIIDNNFHLFFRALSFHELATIQSNKDSSVDTKSEV